MMRIMSYIESDERKYSYVLKERGTTRGVCVHPLPLIETPIHENDEREHSYIL